VKSVKTQAVGEVGPERASLWAELRTAGLALLVFTVLTGLMYPLAITGIAQLAFPHQANGSLIHADGHIVGSELIGQPFDDPRYFWSRPSATTPYPYNAGSSGGSNLAVSNPAQREAVCDRIARLRSADPDNVAPIPGDLVTASGSGLDPHIGVAAAECQVARIARARGVPIERVRGLVAAATEPRQFGILGEPRVNVLILNRLMDDAAERKGDNTTR
jgi:potassium-transporting ATPase KdpC subunit